MNSLRPTIAWIVMASVPCVLAAQEAEVARLEKQLATEPASLKVKTALAEAYLKQCELDKSLATWREVLKAAPKDSRAGYAVAKLSGQLLDLDRHLEVIEKLIDQNVTGGLAPMLEEAAGRALGQEQKARLLYLRGRLAQCTKGNEAAASGHFAAAIKLYPKTAWAAQAAIALAKREAASGQEDEARRRLRQLIADEKEDAAAREEARFHLVQLTSAGQTGQQVVATLRGLLGQTKAGKARRLILWEIAARSGGGGPESQAAAVEAVAAILSTDPPYEEAAKALEKLRQAAQDSQDRLTLESLLGQLDKNPSKDPALAREASFIRAEALLTRAVIEDAPAAMQAFVARAAAVCAELDKGRDTYRDQKRLEELHGRRMLVEAQKLLAVKGPADALPALMKAKAHYLSIVPGDSAAALGRLSNIASLLEHVGEWASAAALYRELAGRFGHLPQGRDALWRLAWVQNYKLDAPREALDAYAEYASRYPADLAYRQMTMGQRLHRLGYANVLDFQKRNALKTDGLAGPATRKKLEELEAAFDAIAVRARDDNEMVMRGQYAHTAVFAIARQLHAAGRGDEAVHAYRMCLNLFPTKAQADDAMISIARIFRDNGLFAEAVGAYEELMEDFPKGDVTSDGYIEAAACLENLGRWKDAGELYEMYVKKFPKYKHVELCKARRALLDDIREYEDFIATNPASPKLPEARYQIGAILYKKLNNPTKAAVLFEEVARRHPKHVRAADGLFTAGTAHLKADNFPAARKAFEAVVAGYPDSRLADDAQFWIAHTYEYSARALGKLDAKRIVIAHRSLRARGKLLEDLALRRQYHAAAKAGAEVPPDLWGGEDPMGIGVLTSGSKRDRVNADLARAIGAYRQAAEKFKMGDKAGAALLRIGAIYTEYLKDPEKGAEAYKQVLAHYPGSKQAIDALYEVGVYHMKKKAFGDAVTSFQQFIYNYPTEAKVEEAMLAIAKCHTEQKAWDKAIDAYQSYLNKYPQGRFAEQAKARIEWIRMYHF